MWLHSLDPPPEVIQVWLPFISFRAQDTLVLPFIHLPVATTHLGSAHVPWELAQAVQPCPKGQEVIFLT